MQDGVTPPTVGFAALPLTRDMLQQVALVAGNQGSCRRGISTHTGAPTAAGSIEKRFK
jgi:hypothetical protein